MFYVEGSENDGFVVRAGEGLEVGVSEGLVRRAAQPALKHQQLLQQVQRWGEQVQEWIKLI